MPFQTKEAVKYGRMKPIGAGWRARWPLRSASFAHTPSSVIPAKAGIQ
jgi:hypothetical protein